MEKIVSNRVKLVTNNLIGTFLHILDTIHRTLTLVFINQGVLVGNAEGFEFEFAISLSRLLTFNVAHHEQKYIQKNLSQL